VHAIELRHTLVEDEDTAVDAAEAPRRIRLRRRAAAPEEAAPREDPIAGGTAGPIEPARPGRLDQVRMRETQARRAAAAEPKPPVHHEAPIHGVEFARSQDATQQILAQGSELLIRGIASGIAPRAPGRPLAGSRPITVSAAIDGMLYAVRVAAGDTAAETAARLLEKLERRFEVRLDDAGDDGARLVLLGLRLGALG
jgi:hypothetical protein